MSERAVDIRVKGELSAELRSAFEDVEVTVGRGFTWLRVVCGDPSVLHGILGRVDVFGLELLDVRTVDATPPG